MGRVLIKQKIGPHTNKTKNGPYINKTKIGPYTNKTKELGHILIKQNIVSY